MNGRSSANVQTSGEIVGRETTLAFSPVSSGVTDNSFAWQEQRGREGDSSHSKLPTVIFSGGGGRRRTQILQRSKSSNAMMEKLHSKFYVSRTTVKCTQEEEGDILQCTDTSILHRYNSSCNGLSAPQMLQSGAVTQKLCYSLRSKLARSLLEPSKQSRVK